VYSEGAAGSSDERCWRSGCRLMRLAVPTYAAVNMVMVLAVVVTSDYCPVRSSRTFRGPSAVVMLTAVVLLVQYIQEDGFVCMYSLH
jgi:hypothetical protein